MQPCEPEHESALKQDIDLEKAMHTALEKAMQESWYLFTIASCKKSTRDIFQKNNIFNKQDLLRLFLEINQKKILGMVASEFDEWTLKDKVFDFILLKIELLEPYKKLVKEQFESFSHVCEKKMILDDIEDGIKRVIFKKIKTNLSTKFIICAIQLLYLQILHNWLGDSDSTHDALMARMDKQLTVMQEWGELLGFIK